MEQLQCTSRTKKALISSSCFFTLDLMSRANLTPDLQFVLNSLISLYSKCGNWRKAEEVFNSMGELRDLVSWSAMISSYARNGLNLEAVLMFYEMVEFGEWPNEYCFSPAIKACSNREYARIGLVVFGFLEGEMMKAVVYLELATRAGETAAAHVKNAIVHQLSATSRDKAMLLANNWRALPSSR